MRQALGWLCAAVLLVFSQAAMEAARCAAQVFVQGVLPALFPMMVLCRMMPASTYGRFPILMEFCTGIFAFASGSPASAQRVRQLWEAGLSDREAQRLLALTGVMSPLFFTGTLAGWTGQTAACRLMLISHWMSAILLFGLWRLFDGKTEKSSLPAQMPERLALGQAIAQSAQAMLSICGTMILFSIVASLAGSGIQWLFPAGGKKASSLLWAVLEIGGGSAAVLKAWEDPPFALLAALCSFGGLSIWMQNLLFVRPWIRPAKLLLVRMLHGALCYGLCHAVFSFWPVF